MNPADSSPADQPLVRSIHPEVRIVSEREGLVDYVASDESLDSYNERILAKGWRFDRFRKNAPFVDSHNYECIDRLLGRVVSFAVAGGQLVERVQWAVDVASQPLAKLGFDLTVKGYLKAVSVGFFPVRVAFPGGQGWPEAVKEAGLDQDGAKNTRAIYLEQQQYELSACVIGANPNAVAKAFRAGDVAEASLAQCGIAGDSLGFLLEVGDAWEQADPMLRAWARRELQKLSGDTTRKGPGVVSPRPDHTQQDAEVEKRERFLAQLRDLTAALKR